MTPEDQDMQKTQNSVPAAEVSGAAKTESSDTGTAKNPDTNPALRPETAKKTTQTSAEKSKTQPKQPTATAVGAVTRQLESSSAGDRMHRVKASKKGRRKTALFHVLIVLLLAVMAYSGYQLFLSLKGYYDAQKLYAGVETQFVTHRETIADAASDGTEAEIAQEETVPDWVQLLEVDFDMLKAYNPDVVGWLYFEGEPGEDTISYPVLYSGDNTGYLRTAIDGKYAVAGSIFLDGSNSPDFSDLHSLIYGHQMRDGSMFGTLERYKRRDDWYLSHMYFQIRTPDKAYRYMIFSYYDVSDTDEIYIQFRESTEDYAAWLERVQSNSYRQTEISVSDTERIVTLSTCSDDNDRFVVNAVLVGSYDMETEGAEGAQ